ncbi:ATP-binding protein [Leptothermofonsia sichuanensis E412]|uniref:Eco57I restriction-modification methylase domain-containing protein n=1 Tax=Leptothermofonsia sichuanensis TaxID=2917832 RepID=UPI001CA662AD|nr:DNA methyltransferase [Leptothermofonsia sichuanensis]QZZ19813.1 ATP-binding protein [Leptothermofonsia sichuanensis E412]
MPLNRQRAQKYLQTFDFESLFIEELGWDTVDRVTLPFEVDRHSFEVVSIAQKRGFIVYQCITPEIPARPIRVKLDRQLTDYSKSHLLVFGDEGKTQQKWLWLKPELGKSAKVRSHSHKVSQNPEPLLQKLEALIVDLKEEETLTHVDVAQKVKQGFDVERVTKQFFQDFEGLHQQFCLEIEGIDSESDRRWYASVLLNRLMFVYFLQRRYFLDNSDASYLQNKLKACQQEGRNFYQFLQDLFFLGFAEPEYLRNPVIQQRIGKICYLNGGLFLRHTIEQKYPQIQISDRAFSQVFDLFSRYSWHLDDRPDKDPLEINPDVLGYIFEKYINQKEFGAYYTRPEITEYLCDRTINKLIRDRLTPLSPSPHSRGARGAGRGAGSEGLSLLIETLDTSQCDRLLNEILPTLTLLDPACGSGAFLVAAMKTLIGIYTQVVTRAKSLLENPHSLTPSPPLGEEPGGRAISPHELAARARITQWLQEAGKHPSLEYYIKKRIITDNLYGVDIMEEATEIAKLRLFLALVASAKTVNDLEPLPNIDFNIMAGNSLIGLIRVDSEGFDRLTPLSPSPHSRGARGAGKGAGGESLLQGNLLQPLAASTYQQILRDKNQSIALYKKHAFQQDDPDLPQETRLLQLRNHIQKLNEEAQAKLNQLLLDKFSTKLGIKYEQAQLTGKPKKRVLNLADISALEPFHWGYHFDTVFARGGFDAIITNPPWETFKPQAKEFFANHSDLVTKNKMDIKAFEKEQKKLLDNPEIAAAWLDYQSKFPYVSAYFRSAEDYINQISIVNSKKAGTDINLYKLFLERCYHLLRQGGECGIVIPSGIYTDLGTKQLRQMLFSQTKITGLFCFENRRSIFEGVDSRFKFVILTFEKGGQTDSFPVRFMRHDVAELAAFPKPDDLVLDVSLIRKLSPDSLSIMEFKEPIDIAIAQKMLQFPLLGEAIEGTWNLKLTREFDMTNDSYLFKTEPAPRRLPLYEGKMIHQFTHRFAPPRYWIDEKEGRKALLGKNGVDNGQKLDYQDYRLGFRDVASNTNERTMIATVISPNLFAGNTLITSLGLNDFQELLLTTAILSSFVVDFSLRQKVTAHCNMFYVYSTPIPRLQEGDQWFTEIVERAAKLICTTPEFDDLWQEVFPHPLAPSPKGGEGEQEGGSAPLSASPHSLGARGAGRGAGGKGVTDETERAKLRAELDGIIAHLYGLTEAEFAHILSTFPLVPDATKQAALNAYRDVAQGLIT